MNKVFTIIGIIVIAIAAFLFLRKPVAAPAIQVEETQSQTVTPAPQQETPTKPTTPAERPTYSYTNAKYKFAVALPGLVVKERASSDPIYRPTVFTFGVGDQSAVAEEKRVPNTMAVYVWPNPVEFQLLMSQMSPIGTETVNGHEFSVYTVTEGPRTSYRYATDVDGVTYDVGVWNRADAQKFFLLD